MGYHVSDEQERSNEQRLKDEELCNKDLSRFYLIQIAFWLIIGFLCGVAKQYI